MLYFSLISTWRNQSLWSSVWRLLLTMDFNIAPTSTCTSFIGSRRKSVLSTSSVSIALALKMLSKSHTRIHPSHPKELIKMWVVRIHPYPKISYTSYAYFNHVNHYKVLIIESLTLKVTKIPMVISSPSSATIWLIGPSWQEEPSFLINSNRIRPFSQIKRFPQWQVDITFLKRKYLLH